MSTMSLAISGTSIRQDSNGRFCLNDLHKAAGGENKHRPNYWLDLQGTKDLIEFLETENPIADFTAIFTKQGLGTFAVKELVYSYAMWISAKFQITVIRAYDAMVSKPAYALKDLPRKNITGMEAAQLKKSIEAACKTNKKLYSELYRKLYGAYGIDSYLNLPAGKLNEALLYLGLKPAEMPKTMMITIEEYEALKNAPAKNQLALNDLPTMTLAMPNDDNRLMVIRHNGITSLFEIPDDYLIGNTQMLARDLKAQGYILLHRDELIARLAA